jgi:hypothetical protein
MQRDLDLGGAGVAGFAGEPLDDGLLVVWQRDSQGNSRFVSGPASPGGAAGWPAPRGSEVRRGTSRVALLRPVPGSTTSVAPAVAIEDPDTRTGTVMPTLLGQHVAV